MANEARDSWSKLQILLGAIVPLALGFIGYQYNERQHAANQAQIRFERLGKFLPLLTSKEPRERELAVRTIGYLAQQGDIEPELVAILQTLEGGESSEVAKEASVALAVVEQKQQEAGVQKQAAPERLPARVYFHVSRAEDRERAKGIAAQLEAKLGSEFVVPGIEKRAGPSRDELRFFRAGDAEEAEQIAATLRGSGLPAVRVVDLSGRYASSTGIRPRHYELWLASPPATPSVE